MEIQYRLSPAGSISSGTEWEVEAKICIGFIDFQVGGIYGVAKCSSMIVKNFLSLSLSSSPVSLLQMALKRKRPVHKHEDSNKRHKVDCSAAKANQSLNRFPGGSRN